MRIAAAGDAQRGVQSQTCDTATTGAVCSQVCELQTTTCTCNTCSIHTTVFTIPVLYPRASERVRAGGEWVGKRVGKWVGERVGKWVGERVGKWVGKWVVQ